MEIVFALVVIAAVCLTLAAATASWQPYPPFTPIAWALLAWALAVYIWQLPGRLFG